MQSIESPAWPRNGFESLIDYHSNFLHLNINLGSVEACKAYHDNWISRYTRIINSWTPLDVCLWAIRCRQSLKLCFSATFFALSATEIGEMKLRPAEHYMAYYGMLHAMWAVLYLHPEQTTENVSSITHSKLANIYQSEFADGKTPIIVENAKQLAQDLRYVREYYSYKMPLNPPFESHNHLIDYRFRLGGFIKQSIQLANLHSHLILKACEKIGKTCADVKLLDRDLFRDAFHKINGQKHQSRDILLLDDADRVALAEMLSQGCDMLPLSVGYEHIFDNYMTWGSDRPDGELLQKVRSLVWHALQ